MKEIVLPARLRTDDPLAHLPPKARKRAERLITVWKLVQEKGQLVGQDPPGTDLYKVSLQEFKRSMCKITLPTKTPNFLFIRSIETSDPVRSLQIDMYPDDLDNAPRSPEEDWHDYLETTKAIRIRINPDGLNNIDWVTSKCHPGNEAMKFVEDIFQTFHTVAAHLIDYSDIMCPGEGYFKVSLALLRTLTHGKTWYQDKGFKRTLDVWEGENATIQRERAQKALQALTVEELAHVNTETPAAARSRSPEIRHRQEIAQQALQTYNAQGRAVPIQLPSGIVLKPGSIGHFATWLMNVDCPHTEEILCHLLPFPSKAYQDKCLHEWEDLPVPLGAMQKVYGE